MAAARVVPTREDEVRDCLARVMDPELDESVLELGFVTALQLAGDGEVHIGFRLPTYWCAPNFAYLMAEDMRAAVGALPWVTTVRVQLHEHLEADAINRGAIDADLGPLRRTFQLKAFERRQGALIEHLREQGWTAPAIVALPLEALGRMPLGAEGERLVERHLERRALVGGAPLAFVDVEGRPIAAGELGAHLRASRRVAVNAEFNGALCRGLLAVREAQQPIRIVRRASG